MGFYSRLKNMNTKKISPKGKSTHSRNRKKQSIRYHVSPKKTVRANQSSNASLKNTKTFDHGKLKIIVMGGNEEVGRNMTLLEYENDIIIVDMGVSFPEEDMPGIDLVIPNIEYLKGKEKI